MLKVPVYTLFGLRDDSQATPYFDVYFEPFSEQLILPRKTRETALQETVQQYASRLESYTIKVPLYSGTTFSIFGSLVERTMTTNNSSTTQQTIKFGADRLTIEDVCAIANGAHAEMNNDAAFNEKIDRGVVFLERLLKDEGVIYGVTTGYGDSCNGLRSHRKLADELLLHLTRFPTAVV